MLGPRALAVISCALALLAARPTITTQRNLTTTPTQIATVEILGHLITLELHPIAATSELLSSPLYRISVTDHNLGLSHEQQFSIKHHLLAPPAA